MARPSSRAVRAEAEKAAREALAARTALVGELAATAHDVTELEGELDKARATHADAYTRAVDGGWTATELATLGFDSPTGSSAPRRATRRTTAPKPATATATAATQAQPATNPAPIA